MERDAQKKNGIPGLISCLTCLFSGVSQSTSAQITVRSLLPKQWENGLIGWVWRPCLSNRAAPGRMDI